MAAPAKTGFSFGFAKKAEPKKVIAPKPVASGFAAVEKDEGPKNKILVETEDGLVEENPEPTEQQLVIPCHNPIVRRKRPQPAADADKKEPDLVASGLQRMSAEDAEAVKAMLAEARGENQEDEEEV